MVVDKETEAKENDWLYNRLRVVCLSMMGIKILIFSYRKPQEQAINGDNRHGIGGRGKVSFLLKWIRVLY